MLEVIFNSLYVARLLEVGRLLEGCWEAGGRLLKARKVGKEVM